MHYIGFELMKKGSYKYIHINIKVHNKGVCSVLAIPFFVFIWVIKHKIITIKRCKDVLNWFCINEKGKL